MGRFQIKESILRILWVLPVVSSFSSNPFYYDNWCDDEGDVSLQYLDDKYCAKVFPSSFDRSWTCPMTIENDNDLDPEIWTSDDIPLSDSYVDTTTLPNLGIRQDVQACLFLIKRIQSSSAGSSLRTKRFCSGGGESTSFETWSSSKFIAMGNAAGKLREECITNDESIGLESNITYSKSSSTSTTDIQTPLSDLATIVASYDTTAGLTSNSVSSYFHDLGWRERAYNLATEWLKVNSSSAAAAASLGGNYGEATPSSLGFDLMDNGKTSNRKNRQLFLNLKMDNEQICEATPDPIDDGPYENSLTALAFAEAHRRLSLHREVNQTTMIFPNATWEDVDHLLYGSENSILFPQVKWGGLSTDPAIYIQSALESALETKFGDDGASSSSALAQMDEANNGTWRVFSKLGAGYSSSRNVGEIVTAGYGCIPFSPTVKSRQYEVNEMLLEEDDEGGSGYEFTIAARASVALDYELSRAEDKLIDAVTAIVAAMVDGVLD